MPKLTLKGTNTRKGAPTSTPISNNASNTAPTSVPVSNNAPTNPQNSAHPPLILHLNANQRRKAEAALKALERAQAALERHRRELNGRASRDGSITDPLVKSAFAAITRFERIQHPGGRTREKFLEAMLDFEETSGLILRDIQRDLACQLWLRGVAEALHDGK